MYSCNKPSRVALFTFLSAMVVACTPSAPDPAKAKEEVSEPAPDADSKDGSADVLPSDIGPSFPKGHTPIDPKKLPPVPVDPNLDPGSGMLKVQRDDGWEAIVLQETTFDTFVVGTVAETTVTQLFVNPYGEPIEAVYQFPLPEDGAVDDYWFHVGKRHVHGVMKRREEARKIYEEAKKAGKSAALLDQERPNIFTQRVANIPPGEAIRVEMHLVQPVRQKDGKYQLVFPTTIGPRFLPGAATNAAGDTDVVPDGSKVTPPTLPPGKRSGNDLAIGVQIDSALPMEGLSSPTHRLAVEQLSAGAFAKLAPGEEVPNKDFVLEWSLTGDETQAAIQAQTVDGEQYFTLTVQPPNTIEPADVRPRELIFVVDHSCSMSGEPLDTVKQVMHRALDDMGPSDAFQVLRFSEEASGLSPSPIHNTDANRARAKRYVTEMEGMGGTMMLAGIEAALGQKHEPGALKLVLFMTDGFIGNESQIFKAIDEQVGDARLFSMGVGSSVNRFLLEGMADMGRGAVSYVGAEQAPEDAVEEFYERIARPVLTDVEIDWKDVEVSDITPARIPDLFAGQPLVIYGKIKGAADGTVVLKGKIGEASVEIPVKIEASQADRRAVGIASLWARRRVAELMRAYRLATEDDEREKVEGDVVELALARGIMTKFTSFVAVDERRVVNEKGEVKTVKVPVEMPEGVDMADKEAEMQAGAPSGGLGLVGTGRGGGGGGQGTIGLGNTGLIGKGGGGGTGSGYGRGSGGAISGRGKRVPKVRQAEATLSGTLDKDIIRRIVRTHIKEVRYCYDKALRKDSNAAGKVVIDFEISPTGKVTRAEVKSTTLDDKDVGKCIASATKRWKFPKPKGGGKVSVSYPFNLSPG